MGLLNNRSSLDAQFLLGPLFFLAEFERSRGVTTQSIAVLTNPLFLLPISPTSVCSMRLLPIVVVLVVLCLASSEAWLFKDNEYVKMFQSFLTKFKKSYSTSAFAKKLLSFKTNMDKITNANKLKSKFQLGVNKFADLSPEEFKAFLGAIPKAASGSSLIEAAAFEEMSEEALNETFNGAPFSWSNMMPARYQDSCGSCWAFSFASTVEAAIAIRDKTTSTSYVSTQVPLDCATGCLGCRGGYAKCVFDLAVKTGYFKESDAPYKNVQGTCGADKLTPIGKLDSYKYVKGSASDFTSAVRINPLWVTLNADLVQLYKSGIVDSKNCSTAINHAVVLIGYGAEAGTNYYTIRNSWGKDWGESGNFRIASAGNMCGIHSYGGYYPILSKK